jgi:hypothetical protein
VCHEQADAVERPADQTPIRPLPAAVVLDAGEHAADQSQQPDRPVGRGGDPEEDPGHPPKEQGDNQSDDRLREARPLPEERHAAKPRVHTHHLSPPAVVDRRERRYHRTCANWVRISGVTSTLPHEVREAFERFITCELTTVDASKQPITWPVTPYYAQGGPTIDLTTGLGYPKKADDARAHPSVALLFSDPTGSGIESGIKVLVQGTATIDDADLKANADRYLRESGVKLPATKKMHPPSPLRPAFNFYYARIYIKVRPERVFVWPDGDLVQEPTVHDAHLEEVRSGHSEEPPEDHGPPASGEPAWDERMAFLEENETGVLSWLGPDGFPIAVRAPYRADFSRREIAIDAEPAGLPLIGGRACLTVHRHAPDFTWQRNMQVRGNLVCSDEGMRLVPRRIVGGFEIPKGVGRFRDFLTKGPGFYRTYRRRMRERAR